MNSQNPQSAGVQNRHLDFLMEEYKALREEILSTVAHLRQIIYLNVVGCGAIWYFILDAPATRKPNPVLYWLPLILCTLCGIYIISLRRDIQRFGRYIYITEKHLLKEGSDLGWEHYLEDLPKGFSRHTYIYETTIWVTFMILNLVGAIYLHNS